MFKTKLNLDVLEAREVPAVMGWTKIDPKPLPPTVVGTPAIVKSEPPPFAVTGKTGTVTAAPTRIEPPPFAVGGKFGVQPGDIVKAAPPGNLSGVLIGLL